MTIFGDGQQTRAFSYIGDVAPLIARSIENTQAYNDTFNVGAEKSFTVNHLAEVVSAVMGKPANIIYLDTRNEVKHAFSNHNKAAQVFDIPSSTTPLEEGVRMMLDWAVKVGPRQSSEFECIEISKNMPQSWKK